MPRVLGVDIPANKRVEVSLTYLYGVGRSTAAKLCGRLAIDPGMKARDLPEEKVTELAAILQEELVVEGALRRQISTAIGRLRDIGCYRGMRHRRGLPVRGQRTRTNARTRKGPRKTVAGKKSVKGMK